MGKRVFEVLLVVALISMWCVWASIAFGQPTAIPIRITVNNPYSLSMNLEVKCDWNNTRKKFDYHEHIVVRAETTTILSVPKGMSKCEIWPHINFFGGE